MRFWLLKTEPGTYDFSALERDRRTVWDGVENNLALKHMREAAKGDRAIIYHTGDERAAVGVATIVSDPYPDPARHESRIVVFDVAPLGRFPRPVTLAELKADSAFADCPLVRTPRLSVVPLTGAQWRRVETLSSTPAR